MQLRRKRFDHPDEVRTVEKARIELVELGELAIGRAVFEPGWRWSEHVKPIVGTESCQVHHIGYVVSGHLHIEIGDGASLEVMGGDAFEIPPGHDAWVVGDEPWVSVDWAGRRLFARSPKDVSDRIFTTVVFTGSVQVDRDAEPDWRRAVAAAACRAQPGGAGGDRALRRTRDEDHRGRLLRSLRQPGPCGARSCGHDRRRRRVWAHRSRGVHAGEVELEGDEVRGIAVHAAARILGVAQPGEVLVSGTVRDLLSGSGIEFAEGEFELRGLDGRRSLVALIR